MNTDLVELEEFIKNLLSKEPADPTDLKIIHGQLFDDNRRWCGLCQSARFICEPVESNQWADKMCSSCSSLWPEYVELALAAIADDEIFEDVTIH